MIVCAKTQTADVGRLPISLVRFPPLRSRCGALHLPAVFQQLAVDGVLEVTHVHEVTFQTQMGL